ncbi:MAG: DUF4331 domain-containing protein [Blastocatellia bacterium]|nr:DUF4331 domain-containing protein [Blastocatellia bacterium]
MIRSNSKKIAMIALVITIAFAVVLTPAPGIDASDHADAPINSSDQAVDQGDTYAFLDPNDNSKVILILTVRGFITPGEAVNFSFFDHLVRYRFEIETTGDTEPDDIIEIRFSQRTAPNMPQAATVSLPRGGIFAGFTTLATQAATPNPPVITTDPVSGVSFFAGEVDDPFFFDIPGFARFTASIRAGAPDPSQLGRGRDTFAGYNILAIALSVPLTQLRLSGNVIGVQSLTQRQKKQIIRTDGTIDGIGKFRTLDRSGNPGLNALIIPFARKNEYNASTPTDDASGQFAGDIVATLQGLGTDATNIGILASVYVNTGDYLRLNTTVANTGPGGGSNAGAGFPNGRRMADDVVDTFLFFASNQTPGIGDTVPTNDVAFRSTFPFLAPPHQPRATGTVDDSTRN